MCVCVCVYMFESLCALPNVISILATTIWVYVYNIKAFS